MVNLTPKLKVKKPTSVFRRPLKADFKALFKALSKGIGHTAIGKWEELGNDTVEGLSAIGLCCDPEELAFLLIRRAVTKALTELIGESASQMLADQKKDADAVIEQLDFSALSKDVYIDRKFLDRPAELPIVGEIQTLLQLWLEIHNIVQPTAKAITARLPSYFVYALNQEWRRNAGSYKPLLDSMDTPFTKASDREYAWAAYSALLQRRIHEGIFDEPFSLSQIFVPLNAYFLEDAGGRDSTQEMARPDRPRRRIIIQLQQELEQWLQEAKPQDATRVISGGPGSGKSSFARIFAARLAKSGKLKVLFVPLHLIDPSKDLVEEVGRFVRDEGVLLQNPLDPQSPEPNLLIIFDGLDELASQGKAAAETARAFLREVDRTVEKRNLQSVQLRVLISGRELVVQENESEFRRPRQILILLPYSVPLPPEEVRRSTRESEEHFDPKGLLKEDLRQQWWKNYGVLTGNGYQGLPKELGRNDLDEITAQPLLNYLVALSFTRGKLDFTKDINLNSIYADLVAAVHERGYEKKRTFGPIRHMTTQQFVRVLEEVGLAAWHGDGRTTTVREIEDHCRASGLASHLDSFQEGAKAGVTRLLAAFFFRQYGQRASGDKTFVFTHKSFGEYLTARRVMRAIERIIRELQGRRNSPDEGWDERDALKHWAQVCGPSSISRYLHVFLLNEMKLRSEKDLVLWQESFAKLFSHVLQHKMPMEQLPIGSFKEQMFQSRNAEEALLVVLNACARVTKRVCTIEHQDPTAFGTWFKRIQGQRTGPEPCLAAKCLSFLDLIGAFLDIGDFFSADLSSSKLTNVLAHFACFGRADLRDADLRHIGTFKSSFSHAILTRANLANATLDEADFEGAILQGAKLSGAKLKGANLRGADLEGANLEGANLRGAHLQRAKLKGANIKGANLKGTILEGTRIKKMNSLAETPPI